MLSAHICGAYLLLMTFSKNWVVMEYCAGGDLAAVITQDGPMPEPVLQRYTLGSPVVWLGERERSCMYMCLTVYTSLLLISDIQGMAV